MNASIVEFIENQTVATICCVDEAGNPYCFNSFYSFDSNKSCLYIKSSAMGTHHGPIIQKNPDIAGTIVMDELHKIQVKGIQFTGKITKNDLFNVAAAMHYHTRHPMAMAVPGELWTIQLQSVKYTDNSMGFGSKVHWEAENKEDES